MDGTALNISSVINPISVGFVVGKEVAGSVAMISSVINPISVGLLVFVSDGVRVLSIGFTDGNTEGGMDGLPVGKSQ